MGNIIACSLRLSTWCFGVYMKAKFIVKDAESLSNLGINLQNGKDANTALFTLYF